MDKFHLKFTTIEDNSLPEEIYDKLIDAKMHGLATLKGNNQIKAISIVDDNDEEVFFKEANEDELVKKQIEDPEAEWNVTYDGKDLGTIKNKDFKKDKKVKESLLKETYNEVAHKLYDFYSNYMKNHGVKQYCYDDYELIPDDFGAGMRIQCEWDGNSVTEETLMKAFSDHFYGIHCTKGFGKNWQHYVIVFVDERKCQESLNEELKLKSKDLRLIKQSIKRDKETGHPILDFDDEEHDIKEIADLLGMNIDFYDNEDEEFIIPKDKEEYLRLALNAYYNLYQGLDEYGNANESLEEDLEPNDISDLSNKEQNKLEEIGITKMVNQAIINSWEQIDYLDSVVATMKEKEVDESEIAIINNILEDVMIHIGQLEKIIKKENNFYFESKESIDKQKSILINNIKSNDRIKHYATIKRDELNDEDDDYLKGYEDKIEYFRKLKGLKI